MVMRREQVHKICLNFFLTNDIEFKRKDDQSWTFGANDFSEGEFEPTSFAVRFKNKEICDDFKKAVDDALSGAPATETAQPEVSSNGSLIKKLMLPENFFEYEKSPDCTGCIGCKSDEYVYDRNRIPEVFKDESPLPLLSPSSIFRTKQRRASQDKKVSFKIAEKKEHENVGQLFGGKVESGIQKSEATTNIFAIFNQENPPSSTSIFGSSSQNAFNDTQNVFKTSSNTSIFSSSLNTGTLPAKTTENNKEQASIFGSKTNFGAVSNGTSIFGGANKENKPSFGTPAFSNTPVFGSGSIFGSALNTVNNNAKSTESTPPTNIFGALSSSSTFSFAEAVKQLDNKSSNDSGKDSSKTEPEFLKNASGLSGFAEIAAASENAFTAKQSSIGSGQFFGLTVKDDFFSKNLNKQNTSTDDASHNDSENVQDENYDPHYDPIISLPDEIVVSTGEEDEEKLFGERAKLYRYDTKTKEWKERGNFLHGSNSFFLSRVLL